MTASNGWRAHRVSAAAFICLAGAGAAHAHSASDAYLTLTVDGMSGAAGAASAVAAAGSVQAAGAHPVTVHGQWDIALRDLDFVLKLDDDGDGRLRWAEVHRHQADIERYAYRYLRLDGGPGNACTIKPGRQMIDDHADGAYAALFFDAVCAHVPRKLTLHYSLFFAIDPSHRGIFVMHSGDNVATALLAPENASIELSP